MNSENKEITIAFRVTAREAARIEKAAGKRRMKTGAFAAAIMVAAAKADSADEQAILAGITSAIPADDLPQFLREMQAAMGSPIAEVMIRFIEAVAIPMAAEYETRLAVVRAMAKELTKLAEKTAQAVELAAQEGRLYADARAAFIEAKAQQAALEKLRRRDGLHLVPRALKV